MHLFELTEIDAPRPARRVPEWTLGCFRRRCITFFNGAEDVDTTVLWLQSHGLSADFRRAPGTPALRDERALADLPLDVLLALARVEGGLAHTGHDGRLMSWSDWSSFQTHAKWPEPGRLERIGNCLVEFAPSGAYVEDWRLEPSGAGPLIGLGLLEERDLDTGAVRHRGGGLVVCGRHAAFVRGRPDALPEGGRLEDFVRAHAGDAAQLARVFAFDAAYGQAVAGPGDFVVTLSTRPWREGEPLLALEGFSYDPAHAHVLQRVEEGGCRLERRFSIDTLEREFSGGVDTPATAEARAWVEAERETLFATVRQPAGHRRSSVLQQ
jgi:hypothetical protein